MSSIPLTFNNGQTETTSQISVAVEGGKRLEDVTGITNEGIIRKLKNNPAKKSYLVTVLVKDGVDKNNRPLYERQIRSFDTVTPVPDVGNFYTFVYNPKTPNIQYDQHPLIACTDIFGWGFRGLNFHWRKYRNYTWAELAGQLYIVQPDELDDLLAIPYAKFLNN